MPKVNQKYFKKIQFQIWNFKPNRLPLHHTNKQTEIMERATKLASATDVFESLQKHGKVQVSFDGGHSSFEIKDFAYFTGLLNQEQAYYGKKIFFDHQDWFRPYYFLALNGRNLPDLSNDKSLD